ncbi:MAG TPA: hypothetical protein VMU99_01660 [Acidimicrobiales bacterium]|nr:hypothetical protein [Acidimicrobiales bacterium]
MSRRIEIELTSSRVDGTWTWRAAGAKQPRGVIDPVLLGAGAKIGDVLRVEIEIGLDGIDVTTVLPPKTPHRDLDRIELIRPRTEKFEGVITTLVPKSEKHGRERKRGSGEETGPPSRPRTNLRTEPRRVAGGERPTRAPRAPRAPRSERPERPVTLEPASDSPRRPSKASRPRPTRLVPKTDRRNALLDSLPPEQRAVAEQLAIGGLPSVRRALQEQQTSDREAGRPAVGGEAIITLAEQLLPSVREAVWLDRAEAALDRLETISLRDLRATVTGATAKSEDAKLLLGKLRAALEDRLTKLRTKWEQEISHALEEGRVLQALRLSAKPPEPSTRFPAALVEPLATASGAALNATTQPERWISLLEAASNSPIRRSIRPTGMPLDPTNAVRQAASAAAGRVPALAKLLGLAIPPPPRPMTTHRPVPALTHETPQTDAQEPVNAS